LQPIIENAVYHGIKPKGMEGLLTIHGEILQNEEIVFTVSDNGVGMNHTRMEEISQKLNGRLNQMEDHIGIYNVNQRIKIVFGTEYGVSIKSEEMQGTEVLIKIPMVKLH
jgi:two-component system sensor histidine kinase YesM